MLIKISNSKLATAIAASMVVLGLIGMMLIIHMKIGSGESTDQYIAMSGVKLSYVQAWYIIMSIPCLYLVMLFLWWALRSDERDFKKKYERKHNK